MAENKVQSENNIHFVEDDNSEELPQLLKKLVVKKYAFVDLWATWCAPCIAEFSSTKSKMDYFKKKDIQLIYLSIDEAKNRKLWKEVIQGKHLAGTHALVNEKVKNTIAKRLYQSGPIMIPRYLIIDIDGKILSHDFTRPSDKDFEKEFDKLIR